MAVDKSWRSLSVAIIAAAVIAAALVVVLISPLFLYLVARVSPKSDWER
jgi:multisubunit Na+/H+ antiporter MnhG subunit